MRQCTRFGTAVLASQLTAIEDAIATREAPSSHNLSKATLGRERYQLLTSDWGLGPHVWPVVRSPDFDLGKTIDSIKAVLEPKLFSQLDSKNFLRSLGAAAGGGDFSAGSIDSLRGKETTWCQFAITWSSMSTCVSEQPTERRFDPGWRENSWRDARRKSTRGFVSFSWQNDCDLRLRMFVLTAAIVLPARRYGQ
jgi:hypothetical protein